MKEFAPAGNASISLTRKEVGKMFPRRAIYRGVLAPRGIAGFAASRSIKRAQAAPKLVQLVRHGFRSAMLNRSAMVAGRQANRSIRRGLVRHGIAATRQAAAQAHFGRSLSLALRTARNLF